MRAMPVCNSRVCLMNAGIAHSVFADDDERFVRNGKNERHRVTCAIEQTIQTMQTVHIMQTTDQPQIDHRGCLVSNLIHAR